MAPGMAAAISCAWDGGVRRSAPPLRTIVSARTEPSVEVWLKDRSRGRNPTAVSRDVVADKAVVNSVASVERAWPPKGSAKVAHTGLVSRRMAR